jgi:hypothetical protein
MPLLYNMIDPPSLSEGSELGSFPRKIRVFLLSTPPYIFTPVRGMEAV